MEPIGRVVGGRHDLTDDDWGAVESTIVLDPAVLGADATAGLAGFSHVEVLFVFHRVEEGGIERGARHPRGHRHWPAVGILAQRAKGRPNRLGVTTCELVAVDGLALTVRGLDAVDGTPVLDVKPYMRGFAPRGPVTEPPWAEELMRGYW
ncbi:MAG TPA: SAM-dependent methyltransferase [Acidimicrobiales bacterium]|nr:SAM-dependent methyltransferase [Acidimicrobiales bacterium]